MLNAERYKPMSPSTILRPGCLVKASYQNGATKHTGIVTSIQEKTSLFSDKYGIVEKETIVHVLCDGTIKFFSLEEDNIEVIK